MTGQSSSKCPGLSSRTVNVRYLRTMVSTLYFTFDNFQTFFISWFSFDSLPKMFWSINSSLQIQGTTVAYFDGMGYSWAKSSQVVKVWQNVKWAPGHFLLPVRSSRRSIPSTILIWTKYTFFYFVGIRLWGNFQSQCTSYSIHEWCRWWRRSCKS